MNSSGQKVSVLLPVKDGEKYLAEAIDSILAQTHQHLELIIINDGSQDGTEEIIQGYSDARIVSLQHETSKGLPASLNEAIKLATGSYLARMDADDVAFPERIEKQVGYLETHPQIGLIGTWAVRIDGAGKRQSHIYRTPVSSEAILFRACFANPFVHPSVMARAEVFKTHLYNEAYRRSQDFELWSRILFVSGVRAANLPEPLLSYRQHGTSLTKNKLREDYLRSAKIPVENIKTFFSLSAEQEKLFIDAYLNERLSLVRILKRVKLSFAIKNAFLVVHPAARAELSSAPWKDAWFFAKYWIKQLIRSRG